MFILGLVGSMVAFPHSPRSRRLPNREEGEEEGGPELCQGLLMLQVLGTRAETKAMVWADTVSSSCFLALFSFRD